MKKWLLVVFVLVCFCTFVQAIEKSAEIEKITVENNYRK